MGFFIGSGGVVDVVLDGHGAEFVDVESLAVFSGADLFEDRGTVVFPSNQNSDNDEGGGENN